MTNCLTLANIFLCSLQVDWSFLASLENTSDPFHWSVGAFYSQGVCTQLITADRHENKLGGGFVGTLCPLWTFQLHISSTHMHARLSWGLQWVVWGSEHHHHSRPHIHAHTHHYHLYQQSLCDHDQMNIIFKLVHDSSTWAPASSSIIRIVEFPTFLTISITFRRTTLDINSKWYVQAYLHPRDHGKNEKEEYGEDLSAGEQLLRLLPELHVHQKERHLVLKGNIGYA